MLLMLIKIKLRVSSSLLLRFKNEKDKKFVLLDRSGSTITTYKLFTPCNGIVKLRTEALDYLRSDLCCVQQCDLEQIKVSLCLSVLTHKRDDPKTASSALKCNQARELLC